MQDITVFLTYVDTIKVVVLDELDALLGEPRPGLGIRGHRREWIAEAPPADAAVEDPGRSKAGEILVKQKPKTLPSLS